MPQYEFGCKKCSKTFIDLVSYDPSGKYSSVKCPHCGSKRKEKLISTTYIMNTYSQNNIFDIAAGKNLERAREERRMAEEASHMGSMPYTNSGDEDIERYDTGIHDIEAEY